MNDQFEVAAGSVIGRTHRLRDRPNQDAYQVRQTERSLIAVVADGCSSGRYSQIGSQLGVNAVVQGLSQALLRSPSCQNSDFWQAIHQAWLEQLRAFIAAMGGDAASVIQDYGLFTIVGVCMTPELTSIFAIGDGIIGLNGSISILGPFPDNAPPYLAYGLGDWNSGQAGLQLLSQCPTETVNSVLIGTDGVQDLLEVAGKPMPGRSEVVPDLKEFWECDRYFRNPDQVRRQLALINRDSLKPDWEKQQLVAASGLLPDDATLVTIRRKTYCKEIRDVRCDRG